MQTDKNDEKWVTGKIGVTIGDVPVEMELTVPADPVKPRRMLPIFQQMTDAFINLSVQRAEVNGQKVSCKAGCGACCSQPVPISEVEIYNIAEVVGKMDEPRRSEIKQRFADAYAHFESINWFGRMADLATEVRINKNKEVMADLNKLSIEYFEQNIPCPFLEDNSCSIHPDRPIACREYLVSNDPLSCSEPSADKIKKIDLVAKPSNSMKFVGGTGKFTKLGVVPLVSSLHLAAESQENTTRRRGEAWLSDFFGHLTKQSIPTGKK